MVTFDANALRNLRANNPDFDRDYAMMKAAVRDCAIAYFWNPIVSTDDFEYSGWSTTLYGGIDHATRTAYIVFRGTDQPIDWTVNLCPVPLPLAHPLAHAGFVLAWKIAKRRLMPWLRAHAGAFDKVLISGHSLGGALALACAYDLACEGFEVERCITVGAPRVYWLWAGSKVEKKIGDRVARLFRQQDFISKVPPGIFGFRHVGKEWVYVRELFGDGEAQPLSATNRWLEKAWYYATGGRLGDWWAHGNDQARAQVPIYAIVALGSLGGVFVTLAGVLQYSLLFLLAATFVFVAVSSVLIAVAAHRSGKYGATREAAHVIEEWQLYYLRKIAAGQPVVPDEGEKRIVEFTAQISASHGDEHKQRLVRNFVRFFGDDSFRTKLGLILQQTLRIGPSQRVSAFLKSLPIERRFEVVCVALLLFGYESEDIDLMLEDGVIRRPRNWTRYYAPSDQDKVQPGIEPPGGQ